MRKAIRFTAVPCFSWLQLRKMLFRPIQHNLQTKFSVSPAVGLYLFGVLSWFGVFFVVAFLGDECVCGGLFVFCLFVGCFF